jgi:peptidoglycan/xylan/chitin deacetylase (PgdA/CDA1 family)
MQQLFRSLSRSSIRALVLMYHRVDSPVYDPWQLSVFPENFRDHISHLSSNYNVISVTNLIGQLKTNSLKKNSLCITFDDAYECNFEIAKPILEEFSCPATFFVPSKFITEQKVFWWDVLVDLVFVTPVLPEVLKINSPFNFHFEFKEHAALDDELVRKHRSWRGEEQPPSERCELFLELNNLFKSVQFEMQEQILAVLFDWANISCQKEAQQIMTAQQLRISSQSPVISIGLHTDSHLALGLHSASIQENEIVKNQFAFRELGITGINVLAYPYGSYNDTTIKVTEKCGISAAFTTDPTVVTQRSNHYRLGRFLVPNINSNSFKKQIKEWVKQ